MDPCAKCDTLNSGHLSNEDSAYYKAKLCETKPDPCTSVLPTTNTQGHLSYTHTLYTRTYVCTYWKANVNRYHPSTYLAYHRVEYLLYAYDVVDLCTVYAYKSTHLLGQFVEEQFGEACNAWLCILQAESNGTNVSLHFDHVVEDEVTEDGQSVLPHQNRLIHQPATRVCSNNVSRSVEGNGTIP